MGIVNADFGGRRTRRRAFRWAVLIVLVLVVFWLLPGVLRFYTDWLWFKFDVRYPEVFWTIFATKLGLAGVFGLAFFALFMANVWVARRKARHTGWYAEESAMRERVGEVFELLASRYLYVALAILGVIIAYGVAAGAAGEWDRYLLYRNGVPFAIKDPIFNRDVGFYVFRLPFLRYVWQWAYLALITVFVVAAVTHYLDKAIRVLRGVPSLATHVKTHLSILLGLILVVKALGYRLEAWNLLYSARGATFGAAYTDVNAQLLAYNVLLVIALVAAVVTFANIFVRGIWLPLAAVGFLMAVSLLLNVIYPALVQRYQVKPAELTRETPYIEHTIAFTRHAFGLDRIEGRDVQQMQLVAAPLVDRNTATIENARLWDYRPLLSTYQSTQALQAPYSFVSVDVDRYTINGKYRQVMLSARELNLDTLPTGTASWQNDHIFYTHGYGLVMSTVSAAGEAGLPDFFVSDIPPRSTAPEVKITRPGIYYGETTSDYVITGTTEKENDYPLGPGQTAKTRYDGLGGVPIGSTLPRLAASVRFTDINILISTILTKNSKILWNRRIATRPREIAPFLSYDSDPYIVIGTDGRLYWIQDAYTVSGMYPYSDPFPSPDGGRLNYLRNSVKVVTDAYDGTVKYYVFDQSDPIIRTYERVFPGMFRPASEMPAGLSAHVRYPEDLFRAQSIRFTLYHMTDPRAFYNRVEQWQIAQELQKTVGAAGPGDMSQGTGATGPLAEMEAYYAIVNPPDVGQPQYLLMIPFTPPNKPNMVAWMAGLCDGAFYGRPIVYYFPKTELVWGPAQIESNISQDPDISERFSLWDQAGSSVIRGNLLVLPLDNSILYVEPVYLKATTNSAIPELKRIIVGRGDGKVAWGATFADALTTLLGQPPTELAPAAPSQAPTPGAPPTPPAPTTAMPENVRALVQQANNYYDQALEAQRNGDWTGYGQALGKLQQTLKELQKRTQ